MVFFIASQFVLSMHIMLKQQGKLRSLIFLSVLVMDALLFSQPETKVYQLTCETSVIINANKQMIALFLKPVVKSTGRLLRDCHHANHIPVAAYLLC
jgi:hypothetical protein